MLKNQPRNKEINRKARTLSTMKIKIMLMVKNRIETIAINARMEENYFAAIIVLALFI